MQTTTMDFENCVGYELLCHTYFFNVFCHSLTDPLSLWTECRSNHIGLPSSPSDNEFTASDPVSGKCQQLLALLCGCCDLVMNPHCVLGKLSTIIIITTATTLSVLGPQHLHLQQFRCSGSLPSWGEGGAVCVPGASFYTVQYIEVSLL